MPLCVVKSGYVVLCNACYAAFYRFGDKAVDGYGLRTDDTLIALDQSEDFARFREAAGALFRVDEAAVDLDVENSAAALDQPGFHAESFLKFVHQTGGFGEVVSLAAIFNSDLHESFPSFRSNRLRAEIRTCIQRPQLNRRAFYRSGQ